MDDEEDEVPTCPLCLEELDVTDRAVKACQCGYQVCLWCLHHIREQLNGRCPACRTPYSEQNFKFDEVNPEAAAKEARERATAKKERERREKAKEIERERARAVAVSQQKAKSNLKHARFLQKNLVYVIGLSLTLAREEVLRRADMFGKFGRIVRILVNRSHAFNADAPGGPSMSAYIQYQRDADATIAARTMNNAVFDGRELRCAIATTKYCDAIVRNAAGADIATPQHCGNPNCMYLHVVSPAESVLTREEVLARQLGPPPPAHLFQPPDYRRLQAHATSRPVPSPLASSIHSGRPIPNRNQTNHSHAGSPSSANSFSGPTAGLPVIHPLSIPMSNLSNSTIVPSTSSDHVSLSHTSPQPSHPLAQSSPNISSSSLPNLSSTNPIISSSILTSSTRLPQASTASPRRSPPMSPTNGRFSNSSRQQRTPTRVEMTTNKSATDAGVASDSTVLSNGATATSSPALPSTVGWASVTSTRNTVSTSPMRTTNRVPVKRARENAPPGFEDPTPFGSLSVPSRPPGFDIPSTSTPVFNGSTNASKNGDATEQENKDTTSSLPPPPGFGPSPGPKDPTPTEPPVTDSAAAAWSQEASADEVFSTKSRKVAGSIGQLRERSPRAVENDVASRSELAQVLAKIGGDLGVSSEFQTVEKPSAVFPSNAMRFPPGIPASKPRVSNEQPLGSLFGAQNNFLSAPNDTNQIPFPIDSMSSARYQALNSSTLPNNMNSSTSTPKLEKALLPRRNISRFGFARQEPIEQPKPPPQAPNSAPQSNPSNSHGLHIFSRGTNSMSQMGKPAQTNVTKQNIPTGIRQSRSRFDFVDKVASPPKSSLPQKTGNGTNSLSPALSQPQPKKVEPGSDAFAASFAQLSTQEKLQSLFNSAQWSAQSLPPMPSFEPQVDSLGDLSSAGPTPMQNSILQGLDTRTNTNSSKIHVRSANEQDRPTQITAASQPVQFAPPGFREATPGTSPEKPSVEKTSTTSGVAGTTTSGGEKVKTTNQSNSTAGPVDESLSSGAESLEEDRKRSKAQRKREKKARQQKEAAERRAVESRRAVKPAPVAPSATPPTQTSSQSNNNQKTSASKGYDQPSVSLKEQDIKSLDVKGAQTIQKETPKVLISPHLNDEPGKFMSVSELEREVEAARAREAQLQDMLLEIQRRIRSYDNVRT